MYRTFKIHFKICTDYDGLNIISLDKVKAQCSSSNSNFLKWGVLDSYNPVLSFEDKYPNKTIRKLYIRVKVKSEIFSFNVKITSGFNGTYITKFNKMHKFKSGILVTLTDIESLHHGFHIPKILDGLSESHLSTITYNSMKDVVELSKSFAVSNKINIEHNFPILKIVSIVPIYDGYCNQFTVFYQTVNN